MKHSLKACLPPALLALSLPGQAASADEQACRNLIRAGSSNSGAMHGDNLNSLVSMALFAAQYGMIWVGGWLDATAQSNDESPELSPIDSDLNTAAHLCQRAAEIGQRFARG